MIWSIFGTKCGICGRRTRGAVPAPAGGSSGPQTMICEDCSARLKSEAEAQATARRREAEEAKKRAEAEAQAAAKQREARTGQEAGRGGGAGRRKAAGSRTGQD